jgi:hypothetical protein
MKIQDKLEAQLVNHGLFEDQAKAILEEAKASKLCEPMAGRWQEDDSCYPPMMLVVVWASVKHVAAEWLKRNAPQHWALPMFETPQP